MNPTPIPFSRVDAILVVPPQMPAAASEQLLPLPMEVMAALVGLDLTGLPTSATPAEIGAVLNPALEAVEPVGMWSAVPTSHQSIYIPELMAWRWVPGASFTLLRDLVPYPGGAGAQAPNYEISIALV